MAHAISGALQENIVRKATVAITYTTGITAAVAGKTMPRLQTKNDCILQSHKETAIEAMVTATWLSELA